MVKFIGEEGFYPKWATKEGRWVAQWVLTSVRGFMSQTDELARPSVSYESLVWAPKAKNPLQLLRSSNPENSRALKSYSPYRWLALAVTGGATIRPSNYIIPNEARKTGD